MLSGPGGDIDASVRAAEALGAPLEALAALRQSEAARELAEAVWLWPENVRPVRLVAAMMTQWRMGPAGPVGLDYGVLPLVDRLLNLPHEDSADAAETFSGVQVLEQALLQTLTERRRRG